jgi:hypothetical protein
MGLVNFDIFVFSRGYKYRNIPCPQPLFFWGKYKMVQEKKGENLKEKGRKHKDNGK